MYPTFGILDWWDYIRPKLPQTQLPFEVVQVRVFYEYLGTPKKHRLAKSVTSHIVQLPGDIVYVPDGWHHAVINIDDVVGISYQSVEYGLPSLATESRSVGDNVSAIESVFRIVAFSCFVQTTQSRNRSVSHLRDTHLFILMFCRTQRTAASWVGGSSWQRSIQLDSIFGIFLLSHCD
eukprot:SAG31_NODE_4432_length_3235_cov_3.104592_2_plen_178_part_00